jgi:FAD/FMN-containing dehydrogenase
VQRAGALAVGAALTTPARGTAQDGSSRATPGPFDPTLVVNDVHTQLNATHVARIVRPDSVSAVQAAILDAARDGHAVSIAGGRHAAGGQQFGTGAVLLDMGAMQRIVAFDAAVGEIEVEAGIQWPALIDFLVTTQRGHAPQWGIIQKQSGADQLSLGGALASNVHGHGLAFKPIISNVVSFTLVDAAGQRVTCSRDQHADLFRLGIGGYGLFGAITTVRLRLGPRQPLVRATELATVTDLIATVERRGAEGALYGDFQFAIDPASDDFLRDGVLSTFRPADAGTPVAMEQQATSSADWLALIHLAHVDKRRAVDAYTARTLAAAGQVVWSDLHQLSNYVANYHRLIDEQLGAQIPSTETIGEIYVPRAALPEFLAVARDDLRAHDVDLIYGSIRLIERDDESFLAWAREPWACVILNLHTVHTEIGIASAAAAFRRLYDLALGYGGSYYLTYHRWATQAQVEAAHPRFIAFLQEKVRRDPDERFQSDWYRYYRGMFADHLPPAADPRAGRSRDVVVNE